jgi:hypothetical protein
MLSESNSTACYICVQCFNTDINQKKKVAKPPGFKMSAPAISQFFDSCKEKMGT